MRAPDLNPNPIYYFAYGMLTDPENMRGARFVGAADLQNYQLEFVSFANIKKSSDNMQGVLWQIDDNLLKKLDRVEGYPHFYNRIQVTVTCNNQRYSCWVYVMQPDARLQLAPHAWPDRHYVRMLATGYAHAGISLDQIRGALGRVSNDLKEVAMNPGAYAQSLASAPKKMLIGFEFEVCVPEKTLEQAQPEKPARTMAEVWKDFKDILNSFEDYVETNDFDRMFKLRGGQRLTIPGSSTAYYKMSDAAKDYDPDGAKTDEQCIKTILKQNSMWKASDFILAFDFSVATVEGYVDEYNELYGIDDDDDDYDDETYRYTESAAVLKTAVKQYLSGGRTPQVFRSYHEQSKNTRDWYIEPDGSLEPNNDDGAAEIVSPPLPVEKAMAALDGFYSMAAALDLYTNESTGLHINVSVPQEIDILKLAVFVGDEYVLKMFGRERSTYADSLYRAIQQGRDINAVAQIWANSNLGQESRIAELRRLANEFSSDHMASVSDNGKYISFRHAGGDYINDRTKVVNVVGRFARAVMIASDPQAHRAEYLKKLTQLLAPATDRAAQRQQASSTTATSIRPAITDIRANGVPAIQIDLVSLWDAPGWNLVPFRIMQIRNSFPFHSVKTRGQNQAALDNIIQRYPGRLMRPNPVAGRDYHASRFLLIPKTLEGARALLTLDFQNYNHDVSAAVDLVRIPLNNTKARDIRLDIQNTIAQLRGSASGQ